MAHSRTPAAPLQDGHVLRRRPAPMAQALGRVDEPFLLGPGPAVLLTRCAECGGVRRVRGCDRGKRTIGESLDQAQAYLDHWEERWADTRIHGTTKRQVAAMFAEEKPALLPLPIEPFRYYQYGKRKVNLDGCVEVDAAYYSAPPGWIGQEVPVQWDHRYVRLLHPRTGELLREHLPQVRGKHRIQDEDRPKHTPPGIQHLLCAPAVPVSRLELCAER